MLANKILVPIGFSEQSILALGQALNLAKIKNSDVVLLSVIKEQSILKSLFLDDNSDLLKDKVKEKLNSIAIEYGEKYDVDIDTMVAKGKIYDQINKVSEMISADLIVMGTNGSRGRSSKIIGSNAEKVVRLSKCPVVTIKGKDHRVGCENIILPLDLEKQTKEKVTYALEYARYWNAYVTFSFGCENIILPLDLEKQTKDKVTYALEYARYWNATIRLVSILLKDSHEIREKLTKNMNQVDAFIKKAGVKCTAELIEGEKKQNLGDFIFEYEKRFDADLIMIMTKKEELSFSNNISETARYIINNSDIPVMSIRPKELKYITRPTTAF